MEQQYLLTLGRLFESAWTWSASLQLLDYLMAFAALLGVAAVYLFIRADQTVRQRIERDYQQHMADREFALRKEVYLPAAEAIARVQDFLGKFPRMDMSPDQAQVVVDHVMGALGKAQLVASESTVRPLMTAATEFTSSYLALASRRQPIAGVKTEIEDLTARIDHLALERDHVLAGLTRMTGEAPGEQGGMWAEMNLRFDKLHREIGTLLGQRKDKRSLKAKLEHEFTLEAAQCSLRLAKLGVPAYLALRDELRLDIDESQYRSMAQRSIGEIERSLKQLAQPATERKPAGKATGRPARREPVVGADEAPREARLRMVLKRSG